MLTYTVPTSCLPSGDQETSNPASQQRRRQTFLAPRPSPTLLPHPSPSLPLPDVTLHPLLRYHRRCCRPSPTGQKFLVRTNNLPEQHDNGCAFRIKDGPQIHQSSYGATKSFHELLRSVNWSSPIWWAKIFLRTKPNRTSIGTGPDSYRSDLIILLFFHLLFFK
ncbi:uncharacterized protein LOC121236978 isoform X2 [Juglans microcarpa x Juglans regia]|uniref:uncharacterized protein LOC121236978 isoform X2 n=1 Tax=Juglans microcarpa x Juglans regia TaxID=2249226 RepID=UPI001B7E1782|nr:uncharacterized protein LOC121236978 isoform X2 [Juglans microcarpa x Juglans regia]